jgi:ubiquinone/menaquinone biosynthesis C-methylase UbiE
MKKITSYTQQDKINNHRIYSLFLQMGMDDGWSQQDKWENFAVFMQLIYLIQSSLVNSTVLDVGCGTGDFVRFLSDKDIRGYMGIDIFEPAIEKAKERFPHNTFIAGDFLTLQMRETFDFVYCSGTLTTKLDTNNYTLLPHWISKMWQVAKKGVVFNFLIKDYTGSDILFLYNPQRVLKICKIYIPQAHIITLTTDAGSGDGSQEMHVLLYP